MAARSPKAADTTATRSRSPTCVGHAIATAMHGGAPPPCDVRPRRRLPRDFPATVALIREPDTRVQLVIYGGRHDKYEPFLEALAPILVPSLRERVAELPRIVEEYAADAAVALPSTAPFTSNDRDWICRYCASSLHEIESATLRVVALRQAGNIAGAARLLGMSHASLGEWLQRRRKGRAAKTRRRVSEPSPSRPRPNATRGRSGTRSN